MAGQIFGHETGVVDLDEVGGSGVGTGRGGVMNLGDDPGSSAAGGAGEIGPGAGGEKPWGEEEDRDKEGGPRLRAGWARGWDREEWHDETWPYGGTAGRSGQVESRG